LMTSLSGPIKNFFKRRNRTIKLIMVNAIVENSISII
jgi:hypothetical protein